MNEIIQWLFGWYNLFFVVPLGIAVGFVAIEVITGGLSDLLPSLDIDFDGDGDVDFDADLDADAGTTHAPAWAVGLGWMGFGKAPFTILLEVLFGTFGCVGLLINAVAHDVYPGLSNLSVLVAVPVAAFSAILVTRTVGSLMHRYIPASASTVKPPGAYVGQPAKAIVRLTPSAGEVKVEGEHQPVFLNARCTGEDIVPQGTDVVLVSYDEQAQIYRAEPLL